MFRYRSSEMEFMDSPDFDELLSDSSFRFIEKINRFFGGTGIVKDFIHSEIQRYPLQRPVRILDIGSGSCDIPISIAQHAIKSGISIEFTCIETGLHAMKRARSSLRNLSALPIKLIHEDIFMHDPRSPYDMATGSMFFHHLSNEEIIRLLSRLVKIVHGSILINDLERGWFNYIGAFLLSLREPAQVRHDAMLSVKKGFKADDLNTVLNQLPQEIVVKRRFPFRIAAVIKNKIRTKET